MRKIYCPRCDGTMIDEYEQYYPYYRIYCLNCGYEMPLRKHEIEQLRKTYPK